MPCPPPRRGFRAYQPGTACRAPTTAVRWERHFKGGKVLGKIGNAADVTALCLVHDTGHCHSPGASGAAFGTRGGGDDAVPLWYADAADINLVAQIVLLVGLWVGFALARKKQFGHHANVQTTMVLANLVLIFFAMGISFYDYVVQGGTETRWRGG